MNPSDLPADLNRTFESMRAACAAAPYPTWDARADRLRRLAALVRTHEARFAQAIDADFGGRPAIETELAEIWPSLEEIKSALRHGRRWMKPRRAGVGRWFLPGSGRILPQPLGVVGVLVPWNYPLYLAIGPMAAALAAGNRVMVKLSEATPIFAAEFQAVCADTFGPDEVAVITGGPDVAAQFSALPFDHLLFTGSTHVGRLVMRSAAENLTPVTLELGGKSPTVITPDYPMEHAVQRILAGKLLNAGQTCIAPDYVLLPHARIAEFVAEARRQARAMVPGGLADPGWCSVVSTRQYTRLTGVVDEAAARGARLEVLFDGPARDDARHRLAATLVVEPPPDSAVMRDEIFGPVLPLVGYGDVAEAIAFVNARPRPLALYWFDHDRARSDAAMRTTHAGGVCINDTLLHVAQDSMPFGGVGDSGMGHYHGQWGFDNFSKMKPIFRQARINAMKLFLPPYSPLARRLLGLMKRL
ncbi:MAG TPA: coniferyl aldehyde dehydrogenase [Quisquiliibacterium sp.]|nr:coniferyl aldehyde dehydrogenase [Quisquiliibacterium sp.]